MTERLPRLTVLAALLVNALLQAVLVVGDPTPSFSPLFVAGAAVSALAWLATYAVVVARQFGSTAPMATVLRQNGTRFALWTAALALVVFVALIPVNGVVGYLVIAAFAYLPIAAMGGTANPVLAALTAIRRGPVGYAWRIVVIAVLVLLLVVLLALNAFFVGGVVTAFANSLLLGLAGWLVTWSLAREYRRVM